MGLHSKVALIDPGPVQGLSRYLAYRRTGLSVGWSKEGVLKQCY